MTTLFTMAQPFSTVRAADLEATSSQTPAWLIEQLWSADAVGILGGPPKSLKTWLALEMAVSVASGSACLGRFPVPDSGLVLLYAAEDAGPALRARLQSLARRHGLDLPYLEIHVITADSLRLDRAADQERLRATVELHRPKLLVLDPLVRLHAIDENAAGEIAALLGYLRSLQRQTHTPIALVHHSKKNASPSGGAGYSLRGSSDLYAWVDSFLYLRSHNGQLLLSAEHRSAPGLGPLELELAHPSDSDGPYLKLASSPQAVAETSASDWLPAQILVTLADAGGPRTAESLRQTLQVRNQRIVDALRHLLQTGRIVRLPNGYALTDRPSAQP
jgi:hypothetical protein